MIIIVPFIPKSNKTCSSSYSKPAQAQNACTEKLAMTDMKGQGIVVPYSQSAVTGIGKRCSPHSRVTVQQNAFDQDAAVGIFIWAHQKN